MTYFFKENKLKNNFKILCFALIIAENYFFLWNKRFLIHPEYLLYNTLNLFIFSLLLVFFLLKIFENTKTGNQFKAIFYTYLFVKIIEILFFYSNITSLSEIFSFLLEFFLENELSILFLKKIIPYLIIYSIFFFFLKKKLKKLESFMYAFSLVFLMILVYNISERYSNYDRITLNAQTKNFDKKVLWIVLDEFDPEIAFKVNNLKNFENLMNEALVLNNSYSPSSHTMESIPGIFMSQSIKNTRYSKNKVYFTNYFSNEELAFEFKNTFLSRLKERNYSFNIVSEVLPYCFMLGLESNCISKTNKLSNYFDGIISSLTPIKYLEKFQKKIKSFNRYDLKKIQNFNKDYEIDSNFIYSQKLKFNFKKLKEELYSKDNLSFVHLFLPKPDVIASDYVIDFYNMNSSENFEKYKIMLNYSDLMIKGINKLIEKISDKNTMIILSSDHWYRNTSKEIKPSLFILKILGDNSKIINNKKVMNIFIPELILGFLNDNLKNHSDISKFIETLNDINMSHIKNNLNKNENFYGN